MFKFLLKNANFGVKALQKNINKNIRKWCCLKYSVLDDQAKRRLFKMDQEGERKIFKGLVDRYQGITVVSTDEPCSALDLPNILSESLSKWIVDKVRGVWFKVFLDHADWVPILAQNGFKFHHAKSDYVMMCKWLPKNGDECNIPFYAHTMVGVGAIVVNSKDEILAVREKYYQNPHWKLPGGYVEPGEDIVDALIREVAEETAVKTKFHSVVAFRHTHAFQFGCSDLYFIASLIPLSDEIVKCEREIMACQWMKIQDFLSHPYVHETNKRFVNYFLKYRSNGLQITFERNRHPVNKRLQCIFSVSCSSNDPADIPKENCSQNTE